MSSATAEKGQGTDSAVTPRVRRQHQRNDKLARQRALGAAIREARGPTSQAALGRRIGEVSPDGPMPQTTVSRWELGDVEHSLETIRAIEMALDLRLGSLLEAAGYVPPATQRVKDVEAVLRSDPNLDPAMRQSMLTHYRAAVDFTRSVRRGTHRSRSTT